MGVVNDLWLAGIKMKGMDVVTCLLITLSSEFNVVKTSIKNQPNENLSLDFVTQHHRIFPFWIKLLKEQIKLSGKSLSYDIWCKTSQNLLWLGVQTTTNLKKLGKCDCKTHRRFCLLSLLKHMIIKLIKQNC